jgi:class 3 adenylate cyclase
LLAGVQRFSLYGVWALMAFADNARVIASTSPDAWVDLDGDGTLSAGDAVQSFGVAVAGTMGRGAFVVFGDDAIFQNKFLDDDNRKLATNLAAWLSSGVAARREDGVDYRGALLAP